MRLIVQIFIVLTAFSPAYAAASIFNSERAVFTATNQLTANDHGLLCVGYSDEQCAAADFHLIAAGASTEGGGRVDYQIEYTIAGYQCNANLSKSIFPNQGWFTVSLKSGLGCIAP